MEQKLVHTQREYATVFNFSEILYFQVQKPIGTTHLLHNVTVWDLNPVHLS